MNDAHSDRKPSYQKWLVWVNTILILFLIVIFILVGSVWFSDPIMIGVINNVISPRLNRLIQKNPDLLYGLVDEMLSKDPLLLTEALNSLHPAPASKAVNKTLRGQVVFLSDFFGSLDMGTLETIIDKIAKDHPEFMNELVDKIVELIRKDFMKSGI